jgi:hypothetical protein
MDLNDKTKTEFSLLPRLHIEGNKIKDENGSDVILRGFDMVNPLVPGGPLSTGGSEKIETTLELMDIAKSWRSNVIKLMTTTGRIPAFSDTIKKIMERAELLGMYVIFSPASENGGYNNPEFPNENIKKGIETLADLIKPYNNGFIQVWNEYTNKPWTGGGISEADYRLSVEEIVRRIRSQNGHTIVGIPGYEWASNFNTWIANLPEDRNVLFSVSDDPWWPPPYNIGAQDRRTNWEPLTKDHVVFAQEFGYNEAQKNVLQEQGKWPKADEEWQNDRIQY